MKVLCNGVALVVAVAFALAAMMCVSSPAWAITVFQDNLEGQAVDALLENCTPPIGEVYAGSNVGRIVAGKYVSTRTMLPDTPYADTLNITDANKAVILNQVVIFDWSFYITATGTGGPSFSSRGNGLIGWDIQVRPDGSVWKLADGQWVSAGISSVRTNQWISIRVVADYATCTYAATVDGQTFSGTFHQSVHDFKCLMIAPSDINVPYSYDNVSISCVSLLLVENFNGSAGNSIAGWNAWTGDSHMTISGTTIDQGNSAGCTSGPDDWSTVAKSFSYTPSGGEEYVLTATISAPNTTGDYSTVRLATASDSVYVGAVLYAGKLYFLQDGDLVNAIQITQSATVMDVKVVARCDQRAYCYYRNHSDPAWIFAGSMITGDALSSYTRVLVCGHEGTGYAGNTDSILLQAQPSLSHGHVLLLDRGLQLSSLIYSADVTNYPLWQNLGYTTLNLFEWPNSHAIHSLPEAQPWSRVYNPLIPAHKHLLTDPCPYDDHCKETDYTNGLASLSYDDEVGCDPNRPSYRLTDSATLADMAACYREWNVLYPKCLAYSNFLIGTYSAQELAGYMQATYPDMLMFDLYPTFNFPRGQGDTRDYWYFYMQQIRSLALAGNDGTGQIPIPYAQHLNLYRSDHDDGADGETDHYNMLLPSESFVRLQRFAGWAFGYTYVNDFVYNSSPGSSSALFDSSGDNSPYTTLHSYIANANNQSRNLGPALVRLLSTDVRMIVGRGPTYDHFDICPPFLDTEHRWDVTGAPTVNYQSIANEPRVPDHQVTLDSSSGSINMVGKDATWSYDTYSYKVGKSAPTGSDMGFGLHNSSTNYIKLHKSSNWNLKIRKSGYSEWVSANLTNTPAAGDVFDFVWSSSSLVFLHKRNGTTLQTITRSSQIPTVAMKAWMWSNSGSVLKIDSVSKANGVLLSSIPNIAAWNYVTPYPGGCTYITSITPRGASNTANPITCSDWLVGYFKPLKTNNSDYPYANGLHFMIVNGSAGNQGSPGIVGPPRTPPTVGDAASASAQWVRIVFNFTGTNYTGLQRLRRSDGSMEVIATGSSGWTSLGSNQYQYDLQLDGGTGDLFRFYPQ